MLSRSVGQSSFFAESLKGRQGVLPETPKESSRASDDTQKIGNLSFFLGFLVSLMKNLKTDSKLRSVY